MIGPAIDYGLKARYAVALPFPIPREGDKQGEIWKAKKLFFKCLKKNSIE